MISFYYILKKLQGAAFDTDAEALIDAIEITDTLLESEKNLINDFFLNLKGLGSTPNSTNFYSKMAALYLFAGDTASSHKWNGVNPLDSDAAYRLTFPNDAGGYHTKNKYDPNGSNTSYANTHLQGSALNQNSHHLSMYFATEVIGNGNSDQVMGCSQTATSRVYLQLDSATANANSYFYNNGGDNIVQNATTLTTTVKHIIGNKPDSSNADCVVNGNIASEAATTESALPALDIYICTFNIVGSVSSKLFNQSCRFASIGAGLTANEIADFNYSVNEYITGYDAI